MRLLTSIPDLAAHLGATGREAHVRAPGHVTLPRASTAMPTVTLTWDTTREVLHLRAPVDLRALGLDQTAPRALALAVAAINVSISVVGLELDHDLAFVTHAFFDEGAAPAASLDRMLQAVDDCEERLLEVLRQRVPQGQ